MPWFPVKLLRARLPGRGRTWGATKRHLLAVIRRETFSKWLMFLLEFKICVRLGWFGGDWGKPLKMVYGFFLIFRWHCTKGFFYFLKLTVRNSSSDFGNVYVHIEDHAIPIAWKDFWYDNWFKKSLYRPCLAHQKSAVRNDRIFEYSIEWKVEYSNTKLFELTQP